MRLRRMAAGVIAAGMMVSLSGCGSSTGSSSGDAAALTQANFSRTVTSAQQAAKSAHFVASIKAAGHSISMAGDASGFGDLASAAMDLNVKASGKSIEMRLVHKVLFLHGAGMPAPAGKSWVKVDLNDANNPLSKILDTAGPRSMLTYLRSVTSLDDKGTQTVDGVQAHHYSVTIDTAKALASNPAFKGQDLSKLGMPKTLHTDVWLDSDNRPVKMTVVIGTLLSLEVHVSKYGEPVAVHAPPAAEVGTFSLGG
ncbi:MAG: hypothetical protein QOK30_3531 [Nocardioidaceae bacterium]|jgi:hypothetical protein|nr:hypothetical protein [Nocardioidaceae bacterium]